MDNKELLLNYLKTQRLMAVATVGSNGPWIANVFYAVDDDLNFYFLSYHKTRHAEEIANNEVVAIAIANTDQKLLDKKIGVQMEGTAHVVRQSDDHTKAIQLWLNAQEGYEDKNIFESVKAKFMMGTIFVVRPKLIRFLNEAQFGENGVKEIVI